MDAADHVCPKSVLRYRMACALAHQNLAQSVWGGVSENCLSHSNGSPLAGTGVGV